MVRPPTQSLNEERQILNVKMQSALMEEIGRPPTCGVSVSQCVIKLFCAFRLQIALAQCRVQLPASHHNQPRIMRRRFIVSIGSSVLFNMTFAGGARASAHRACMRRCANAPLEHLL